MTSAVWGRVPERRALWEPGGLPPWLGGFLQGTSDQAPEPSRELWRVRPDVGAVFPISCSYFPRSGQRASVSVDLNSLVARI